VVHVEYVVGRLRWQLGLERLGIFAIRGAFPASVLLIALWISQVHVVLWLASLPIAAAVLLGLIRWPSDVAAARAFDQRAHLEERLATAVELTQRERRGRFDALQIRDAAQHVQNAPRVWLVLDQRAAREAAAALGAILTAALVVAFVHTPPFPSAPEDNTAGNLSASVGDELQQRAMPLEDASEPVAIPTRAPAPPNLGSRVLQEQAERTALDKLAQGLSNLSAAQAAADDIQQGDFSGARDQLQNLADNADQLSDAAKQQLARGLQQASSASTQSDKPLADREQQAAQALTHSTYADQRQSLRALGDQVQRSGAHSVPADQLERDVGQLQQQGASQGPGGQAEQNGPGVGTGANPDPYSDTPQRLDTSGQQVQVPLKLGTGPGVRPPDGSDDQTIPNQSLTGKSVTELAQSQQTGQVTPEQNLVPGEQRPVVRGYFR
jgi:hypothetical protein